ncbi:MAG: type II toxin-antitoxin system Phd/YefM family antitoxin [Alphaproteobacteria bacterium]|nr:type II toxin-antitoxin system Phd/YefM family antitoxin [Alphaproteobacteria bacterium]
MAWRLAEAKNKFSEVVDRALTEGPQTITRRGDKVVVLSEREFQQLKKSKRDFVDFLLGPGPTLEGVDLTRSRSKMRPVKL